MSLNYNIFDNNTEVSTTSNQTKTFYTKVSKRQFSRYNKMPRVKIISRNNFERRTLRY